MNNYLLILFSSAFFLSCNFDGKKGTVAPTRDLLKGKKLYANHCAGCHQTEGEGLGKVYPPIKNSDYLKAHFKDLPCIIRNGMDEKTTVNGIEYSYEMYGVKGVGDYEIAAICNYIAFTWQVGDGEIMTKEKVTKAIESCK
jgi:cytochrome c551